MAPVPQPGPDQFPSCKTDQTVKRLAIFTTGQCGTVHAEAALYELVVQYSVSICEPILILKASTAHTPPSSTQAVGDRIAVCRRFRQHRRPNPH
jgi:hypothetical protein